MSQGQLYIIAAPSGAGKTSLVRALVQQVDNLVISISYVTRAQRPGEIPGVNYHFVDTPAFERMIAQQEFLEYAQVFGLTDYYGTSRTWVTSQLQAGHDVILEIDWQGARQIRAQFADTLSIFILPPSLEVLQQRLYQRQRDCETVIAERMQRARQEIMHYAEFDYLIINEDFDRALCDLVTIVQAQRLKTTRQREVQQGLLHKLLESE